MNGLIKKYLLNRFRGNFKKYCKILEDYDIYYF